VHAAAATPEPPTTRLVEIALAAGYRVSHQRWRAVAACIGVSPETFLPERGQPHDEPMSFCTRCEVRLECLREALALGQGRSACGAVRAAASGPPRAGRGGTPSGCSLRSAKYAEGRETPKHRPPALLSPRSRVGDHCYPREVARVCAESSQG
jgi:Transcription factor WhiB